MQTILGASGQIARELARELTHSYSAELRLVSRNPQKVNDSDSLMPADLLDARQTLEAVKGSRIVYFAAGCRPLGTAVSGNAAKRAERVSDSGGKFCLF